MKRRSGPGPNEPERAEIDEFVRRQVSTADAFITVVKLGGRPVSETSLYVAEFLKDLRFWERRGCVVLLVETEIAFLRGREPSDRDHIIDEVEQRFETYYEALEKGGYL